MKLVSSRQAVLNGLTVVLAAVVLYGGVAGLLGEGAVRPVEAQSDVFLSRRVDQVEQRFYQIESRLNRMEMESRTAVSTPRMTDNKDIEIAFLRSQIESLRNRLGEVECALLKVDERTLTAAQRRTTAAGEPCRGNWGQRITLSSRPGQ